MTIYQLGAAAGNLTKQASKASAVMGLLKGFIKHPLTWTNVVPGGVATGAAAMRPRVLANAVNNTPPASTSPATSNWDWALPTVAGLGILGGGAAIAANSSKDDND